MRTILVLVTACLCHVFTHAQTTLTFDGVDDYTQSNYYNQLDLGTGNFALEAMVSNLDFTISDTLTILAQQNTNSTQGVRWAITHNTIFLQIESTSYSMSHTFTGCTHLAVVRDNGELLFYANHILLGAQSIAAIATMSCTSCDLLMGKTIDDNNYFKGTLDEVRIWNTARSGINIESYETTCLDSTAMANTSLVGYWNFEENTGQFANNLGSIAHYARLGNTFYNDGTDPTWTTTSCVSSTCYSNGLASFSLSDNNPKEADLVILSNTSVNSSALYWAINGDTTLSVDSLQYAFSLGMNVIQLAVTSASGLSARTVLLDVKRPKYPCGTDAYTAWRQSNAPNYQRTQSLLYRAALQSESKGPVSRLGSNGAASRSGSNGQEEYHIPVIFHVIADNQATLSAFPASRIQAQLDTLNKYFSKDSTGISFCLAQVPLAINNSSFLSWGQFGSSVPGITYLLDTLEQYDFTNQVYKDELMRQLPFDAKEYLNIYIVDTIIYPGTSYLGVSSVGPNYEVFDGIGLDYDGFVGGAEAPMGKSLVHEVGHWLGLEHVFEPDGICDTYEQFNPTSDSGVGNCSTPYSYGTSCPPNPIYNRGQNHMDYYDESCLTVFTGGQIDRMHYVLDYGRPYIHSTYNLVATGVQALGACVNKTNASAAFIASGESVCVGSTIRLNGVDISLTKWEWQISWDPSKNNGDPAPSTSGVCVNASPFSGVLSSPETTISICEPGIWDVYLTINDTIIGPLNPIIAMDIDSMSIEVLDCSPSDQRNRVTLHFDSTDWQINGATIDNLDAIPSDTTVGHIVTGTGFIINQNSEGVVMRTNVFGSPLWRKAIRIPNADVELFDVVSGVDYMGTDRIALVGRVKRANTSELLLVIVDRAGNLLFQETYQMEKNGIQQPFIVGLELIQLSNSGDLAIVGFVGDGDLVSADKRGFILGINPTTGIQWEHYFESEKLMSTVDYDIAESVTEIVGDFGNGPEAAIVVSGHTNRMTGPATGSGSFVSCLTVSGGIVTEQWRKNAQFASGQGSSKPVAVAYDNGLLFFVSFNSLLHGSLIIEINPNTGDFGIEALINNLYPVDLIIDGTNLVLGGRGLSNDGLAAVKIPIPTVLATNFNPTNIVIRSYSATRTNGAWGGLYNVSSYIKTPQCIVPSANGGYMFIGEQTPIIISNNSFNDIGLVFNKIDDNLLSTCMDSDPISSQISNFPFAYVTSTDSISLTSSLGVDSISCDSLIATCYELGCVTTGNGIQSFNFNKCSEDTIALVGDFSEIGDFSYQWSPTAYLSGATILAPTTTTPRSQTYSLTITDNTTGCQVAIASYNVTVPSDTIKSLSTIDKCPLDAIVLENNYSAFNTGVFTYQWSPAIHLSGPNTLEPTTSSTILPMEYTLVATEEGGCSVHEIKYTISASGGLVDEHRINCLPSDPSFYVTTDPSPFTYRMNLNVVLANLGISDTTGVWVNALSIMPLHPLYFDPATSVLVAGAGVTWGTLYYSYGDTMICQNGLILHFGPDASIDGASIIDVCDGAELTFNTSNVDPSIEHRWVISGYNQGQPTFIQSIPFGDSLSITGTFSYNPAYEYYEVVHYTTSKNCSGLGLPSSTYTVKVYVHPGDGTITIDTCTEALILPTNTANDIIQWYNATTGLAITGETTHTYSPTTSGSYYASVTTPQCDFISDTFNYSPLLPISSIATVNSNYNGADISCFGASDGVATVTISNGLSPYTYLWSNGDVSATASNLAIGNYQVTVIDACMDTAITSVILTEPTALVLTVNTLNNVSCAGLNDGSANLTISGGTAPYAYLWSNTQTTATATGLAGGVHTVTVTDNNGCSVSSTGSVTEPIVLGTSLTNTSLINCAGGSDGAITATTTGGTLPYTYLWSDAQTGATATGLVAGVYSVTVTDDNGCTVSSTGSVTEPIVLGTSLTNTSLINCAGGSDGAITATTTGGTLPYTYLWSDAQTGVTAIGLVAGVYSVTVTDNNGCTVSSTASITEPIVLGSSLTNTNLISCAGASDGAITATTTGGTLPYTYLWSDTQTGATATGLVAGVYSVTVTDDNGCTMSSTASITEPIVLGSSLTNTNLINCAGGSDGAITATITGGTLPYTYLWSDPQNQTGATATGLVAGVYSVTVTDDNGCTMSSTASITEPIVLGSSLTNTNLINCAGGSDGAITATTTGGTLAYTYLWSDAQTGATAIGLVVGVYSVTVTDNNGCTVSNTTSVTEPIVLGTSLTNTNLINCVGGSDGGITATTTGGTLPYTYLWSDAQTGVTAIGLVAGVYSVTVTDNNGCTVSSTTSVTEPIVLGTSLTNTSLVNCAGGSDGGITATTTGGTLPYTYLWSDAQTGATATGLAAGVYSVTVTDNNGCTVSSTTSVTEPIVLGTSLTNTNLINCAGGSDGGITATTTGGTLPYTYLWSNTQTGATATGLAAGVHSVTVTDNNGCTVISNMTITEPTVLTTTLDSTNVNCITTNSGVIDNTPTGGTLPYTYLWSNGATSQDVNGLVAGNYCVTITDANNCTILACTNIEPLITPFSIVKLVDKDTIVPYDTVCYSILVTNNCQASKDVVVTDTLPAGLLVSTLGSFTYDNITSTLSDTLTIAAGATDTLQFKVQVLKTASCGNIDSLINQANAFELGSPTPIVSDVVTVWIQDSFATNCMPLPDTVYFSDLVTTGQLLSSTAAQSTIQMVNVAGVWILDVGLSYSFTNGSILEMSPGAQIIVSPGANLTLNNATVRAACNNCLWQSILVQGDGTIATERTVLRDAQYAIHAEDKAILPYIRKTDFLDNFIGIYVAPNANNNNLVLGKFENNIFSAPSILPPYVGLQGTPTLDISGSQVNVNPNATEGTGLSGILGWDLIALNLNLGTPVLSNTFQRLVSGIVLFNTNFSTNSCSFNTIEQNTIYATNLAYQGCGIHVQSPMILDFKEALVEDCSFENCFIGISGIGCGMRIYRNQMNEIVDMGVRSMRLFNTLVHVRFNNFSKMERFGVAAFDPRIPSDIWIDNNTMDMTTIPGEGACIFINDNSTVDASSLVISNNTLSANEAQNGIAVLNHENSTDPKFSGLIQGNTITMEGNSSDRAGISGSNSRLHIECNTVTGDANGQTLNALNTYGIVVGGGPLGGVSTYQCNNVTNTYTGVFFEGFNNNVVFRGNAFDEHRTGLLLDGGAAIGVQSALPNGPQEYNGNTWTGGANLDAWHQSSSAGVRALSRFDVNTNSNNNPEFAPSNIGNLNPWFVDNTNLPNFDCVEPFNYCGNSRSSARNNTTNSRNNSTNNPRITGLDNALARNGLGNIPLVTKYNAKRALFRKLMDNPSLANNSLNPHIRSFVARHQNTCIGHFDDITAECEQAFTMSSIDSILLDSCKNTCMVYLDSLHNLDSMLAINFTSIIATNRNGVANRLSSVMQQQQVLLDNLQRQQQMVLTPICANNNSFNTTVLHEVLEKEVNDIYLNTLAKGILEFSNSELSSLRRIGGHCPQEGGAAVHQARGMLSMVENIDLLNFNCVPNNSRSSVEENSNESEETINAEAWNLILYPNPTNSTITLESNLVLEDEIQIEVYNALGQKVKAISINENTNTIDLNVSSLLDGIYNIRLQSGAYKITKSFVLIK